LLVDHAGDDTYRASHAGDNGGGALGAGLLADAGGTDRYEDDRVPGGACTDCTVPAKGTLGAQIDAQPPPGAG
jgi:hypothetical protein